MRASGYVLYIKGQNATCPYNLQNWNFALFFNLQRLQSNHSTSFSVG
jgi:hypothetical protein